MHTIKMHVSELLMTRWQFEKELFSEYFPLEAQGDEFIFLGPQKQPQGTAQKLILDWIASVSVSL